MTTIISIISGSINHPLFHGNKNDPHHVFLSLYFKIIFKLKNNFFLTFKNTGLIWLFLKIFFILILQQKKNCKLNLYNILNLIKVLLKIKIFFIYK